MQFGIDDSQYSITCTKLTEHLHQPTHFTQSHKVAYSFSEPIKIPTENNTTKYELHEFCIITPFLVAGDSPYKGLNILTLPTSFHCNDNTRIEHIWNKLQAYLQADQKLLEEFETKHKSLILQLLPVSLFVYPTELEDLIEIVAMKIKEQQDTLQFFLSHEANQTSSEELIIQLKKLLQLKKTQDIAMILRIIYIYQELKSSGTSMSSIAKELGDIQLPNSSECAALHLLFTLFPFFKIMTMLSSQITLEELIDFAKSVELHYKRHKQVLIYLPYWSHWCKLLFMNTDLYKILGTNSNTSYFITANRFPNNLKLSKQLKPQLHIQYHIPRCNPEDTAKLLASCDSKIISISSETDPIINLASEDLKANLTIQLSGIDPVSRKSVSLPTNFLGIANCLNATDLKLLLAEIELEIQNNNDVK